MSRLPAPGFSRLKAPGFTKPSVAAAVQIPLPDEKEDTVFKKPQPVPQVLTSSIRPPRNQPLLQGIKPPRSTAIRAPAKDSSQINTSHGAGPYERTKPPTSHVPYVGKKRTTGALKAPVSSRPSNGLKPPAPQSSNLKQGIIKQPTKTTTTTKAMGNSDSMSKPVKRQLIPDGSSAQSKLVRPKGMIGRPNSVVGGPIQPVASGLNKKSPMSSSKGISRSLQSIPQGIKPRGGMSKIKSTSSDELSSSKVQNSSKPKLATIPSSRGSQLGRFGKPSGIRPRASSFKTNIETPMTISTPCNVSKPDSNKLDRLKISPIGDSSLLENSKKSKNDTVNGTFDSSLTAGPIAITETGPSDESSSLDTVPFENAPSNSIVPPESFNTTYNKSILPLNNIRDMHSTEQQNLNATTVISSAPLNNTTTTPNHTSSSHYNNNNNNLTKNLNKTHVISMSHLDETDNHPISHMALGSTTIEIPDVVNNHGSTSFFNQTRVINHNPIEVNTTTNLNATHVITNQSATATAAIDNDVFNESDFLDNQEMPLYEETPLKRADVTTESLDTNSSFTDDILKVIAAISSNINTQPEPSVVMTTSPMKQPGNMTEHVLHHEVINTVPISTTTTTTTSAPDPQLHGNTKSDTLQNTGVEEEETLELLSTPNNRQTKSKSMLEGSPKTPSRDDIESDDTIFDIGTRAYSVSAADLRRNKVSRRNTFQAHDSSKFRIPKEMNLLETLEGNILMDNTSFLQFSNDTRAIKTMLLKLKRTLLEADCPSPLVKAPLKRSNSCAVRKVSGESTHVPPPLLPRNINSSPMAVVDPLVSCTNNNNKDLNEEENEKENHTPHSSVSNHEKEDSGGVSLNEKFQESLRRIEELEKETECHRYTIKLLQTQLETTSQNEEEMLEENILLREEVSHLSEKLQRLLANPGSRERNLSSGSYKEEFDLNESTSRKGILQRMYSNELTQEP